MIFLQKRGTQRSKSRSFRSRDEFWTFIRSSGFAALLFTAPACVFDPVIEWEVYEAITEDGERVKLQTTRTGGEGGHYSSQPYIVFVRAEGSQIRVQLWPNSLDPKRWTVEERAADGQSKKLPVRLVYRGGKHPDLAEQESPGAE